MFDGNRLGMEQQMFDHLIDQQMADDNNLIDQHNENLQMTNETVWIVECCPVCLVCLSELRWLHGFECSLFLQTQTEQLTAEEGDFVSTDDDDKVSNCNTPAF